MATSVNIIAGWQELNDAIAAAMQSIIEFLAEEPPSEDPASAFQQAQSQMLRLNRLSQEVAAAALQEIDDEIAASDLVDQINALSKEAKDEADALRNAAKTIQGIADVVGKIAGVITKVAGLPFL